MYGMLCQADAIVVQGLDLSEETAQSIEKTGSRDSVHSGYL
jgi:hypothetical protein